MFLYVFIITNTYTTFFATQFTVPTIRLATDQEMFGAQLMEPIKDFGIGESCLFELTQGERNQLVEPDYLPFVRISIFGRFLSPTGLSRGM